MTDHLPVEVKQFTVKETAVEIRKALKAAYPGVKFSVRMSSGTGYGWLGVSWTDGPPTEPVNRICGRFQDSYFDGQVDGYHRIEPTLYAAPDGSLYEPRYSCCGVNTARGFSPAAEEWAARTAIAGTRWWRDDDAPQMFDPAHYAAQDLLAGVDLTHGIPENPAAAYADRWHR